MDKLKYRAVIKFFVSDGVNPKEIHPKLKKVQENSAHSITTVKVWATEFKHGRMSLEDDPRKGEPETATTQRKCREVN
jgi:hypothetical protein